MQWPDPWGNPEVNTTILDDDIAAKGAAEPLARETEG